MANDHEPDVGQLWRGQPRSGHALSTEAIQARARDLDARVHKWRKVVGLMFALLLAKSAWEIWVDTDLLERAGDSMLAAGMLYVVYWFAKRARTDAPSTLGQASCVEHYRAQLVRQYELSRDGWKFILPFVPGVALILFGRAMQGRPSVQVAILIMLALVLFAGVLWVIARGARALEREIAALDGE